MLLEDVAHGDQADVLAGGQAVDDRAGAAVAAADQGDLQFVAARGVGRPRDVQPAGQGDPCRRGRRALEKFSTRWFRAVVHGVLLVIAAGPTRRRPLEFRGIHVFGRHIRGFVFRTFGHLPLNHRLMVNFLIAKFYEKFLNAGIGNDVQSRHIKRFRLSLGLQGHFEQHGGWT